MRKIEMSVNEALAFAEAVAGHWAVKSEYREDEFLRANGPQTRWQSNAIMKDVIDKLNGATIKIVFSDRDSVFLSELLKEHSLWLAEYMEGGDTKQAVKIAKKLSKKIKGAQK